MLFEKIVYPDDFPINITIASVTEYPFHYHQDTEIIFCLKGEVRLKNVCHNYLLKEGDIFTNSGHEIHCLTATDQENVVAVIQVSNRFFTQYFPTLGKACFMSYVKHDQHRKMDALRKILLRILLNYSIRSFDYKSTCIDQMIEAIKYLNQHFNLFAFEGSVVVNFQNDDSVAVERISRIINFVYANHTNRITLKDLAAKEHLSTFYISHLIRDYMGISFQEFLCFARVEMSEILLLETDRKISTIAKEVCFSTTSHYEKFFEKWFGHTPLKYRELYSSHVLSDARPARFAVLPDNQAIRLIRQCLSAVSAQEKSASVIKRLHLTIELEPKISPLKYLRPALEVVITPEDYSVMGERLFQTLGELNPARVVLAGRQEGGDDHDGVTATLTDRLRSLGCCVSTVCDNGLGGSFSAGHDSIAAAIQLFHTYFTAVENRLLCRLRDQGAPDGVLKRASACLTSGLIPKPSFYAYRLLGNMAGELLGQGNYHYVIKNAASTAEQDSYTLVAIHYNDEILNLCRRDASVHEASDLLRAFQDELDVDFRLPVQGGQYVVAEYALTNGDSIFDYLSQLGFPEKLPLPEGWMQMLNTAPKSQVSVENAQDVLHLNASVKGAGIHVIVVQKVADSNV